ncbi:MAG: carbohydrate binding family 9 domain-containing protein [bacterium]|nr:carbohydrate binding family 9 domain-containing protein [bacterium]
MRGLLSLSLFSLVLLTAPILATADPDPDRGPHRVPRVDAPLQVDGVLDEALWLEALVLEPAWEVDPGVNIPAPVRTEVLLAYSRSHLYVGFRAWDPDPAAIAARLSDRDQIADDDHVGIVLDTFNDQRRTYNFACNPLGIQSDEVESPQGGGGAWDAIWDSAGRITGTGYVVEMAVPFNSLSFQRTSGDQVWGVDAIRGYPRDVAHEIGLFPRDRSNNCYMCQAEKLIGFAGAEPGRDLEIDPTFSAFRTEARAGDRFVERESDSDFGLTARWGMSANLTLNATVNPDFSQVEADAAQLDVNTQFALYFPERRPFFLEGADYFSTRMGAVYTRTLADPRWGVKLTGKVGRNAIGFFTVEDELTNLLFPGPQSSAMTSLPIGNTATVFRYRRDVGKSSNLGVLLTDREGEEYSNRLVAVDGYLRFTPKDRLDIQVLGSRTHYPDAVAAGFDQPEGDFEGTAFSSFFVHGTQTATWFVVHERVSRDFRADLGFVPQAGYTWTWVGWNYKWYRDPGHWFTFLKVMPYYQLSEDAAGGRLHEEVSVALTYNGPYRSSLSIIPVFARRTYRGVELDSDFLDINAGIRPTASLSLDLYAFLGDGVDYVHARGGDLVHLDPTIGYRFGRHLTLELDHSYERLDVEGGRLYEANVSRLRTVYQFTRRSFLRAILQYVDYRRDPELYTAAVDERFKHLFSQLLFSYKINPRTVLFLGYSDNHLGDQDLALTQTDRTVFFKVGYAWAL